MRYLYLLISLVLTSMSLTAQIAVGSWRTHYSYSSVKKVVETEEKVYGLSLGELYYYDKQDNSTGILNKENGLSDSQIYNLAYNPDNQTLVIAYSNGNIDILTSRGIFNIPDLKKKVMESEKLTYEISFQGNNAYLSTSFGVVVLNLQKQEIRESYIFNQQTSSTQVFEGFIYTCRNGKVYKGNLKSNLLDQNNWIVDSSLDLSQLLLFQDRLIGFTSAGDLYLKNADDWSRIQKLDHFSGAVSGKNAMIAFSQNKMWHFETLSSVSEYNLSSLYSCSSINGSAIWVAQNTRGINLVRWTENGFNYEEENITVDGPYTNNAFQMTTTANKLLVVGGDRWSDRGGRPAELMFFENEQWTNVVTDTINIQGGARDFIRVTPDSRDENKLWVASWGEGLFEYQNNELLNIYNSERKNSSIESIFPGQDIAVNYNRVDGPAFDKKNNMFLTNTQVKDGIQVRLADGKWASLYYSELANKVTLGNIIIDQNNYKWVIIPRPLSQKGIFVFDTKETIENTSDDQTRFFSSFYDQDGKMVNPVFFYCFAEDKDGAIWVGTELGPLVLNNTRRAFESNYRCTRIKIARNDGSGLADYLLDNVQINAIAIDGANRKWIASESNGVYLISADGQKEIYHFTTDNSPLPSNKVQSVAVHPVTGEVFFGTEAGIISYKAEATEGAESYEQIYTYPNPVRPEYEGPVTVTNLKTNSLVKITDINNNLVCEGRSTGGQFVWNQKNLRGERVPSGIYLVYATPKEGSGGGITKIMIVR
ncbi:MAG: two-component regulator propeller domain-containing protein [Bacteroidales bacterium]